MIESKVIAEIDAERRQQDVQWGGASHDDKHTPGEFLQYILKQHTLGRLEYTEDFPYEGAVRSRLLKIAALAIAAIESIDRRIA